MDFNFMGEGGGSRISLGLDMDPDPVNFIRDPTNRKAL